MESMTPSKNRRIVLAARPQGEPKDSDFRLEEVDIPSPGDNQVLLRNLYPVSYTHLSTTSLTVPPSMTQFSSTGAA